MLAAAMSRGMKKVRNCALIAAGTRCRQEYSCKKHACNFFRFFSNTLTNMILSNSII